jgi:hypothetical protein
MTVLDTLAPAFNAPEQAGHGTGHQPVRRHARESAVLSGESGSGRYPVSAGASHPDSSFPRKRESIFPPSDRTAWVPAPQSQTDKTWIPAFAGMTTYRLAACVADGVPSASRQVETSAI